MNEQLTYSIIILIGAIVRYIEIKTRFKK